MKMKRTKSYLFAGIGLAVLVGSLVLAGAGSSNAAPGAQDVNVVNNVDHPVPTRAQGTTNIAGNVGIIGTPTFEVGNTAANPVWIRDADGVARQPFETGDPLVAENTQLVRSFSLPIGNLLVIKHIFADVEVPRDQSVRATLTYNLAGAQRTLHLVMTPQGTFGTQEFFATSQPVEIAVDPSNPFQHVLLLTVERFGAGAFLGSGHVSLSGYLVDLP